MASGLESGATITSTKLFWSKVEYIGSSFAGVFWLSFALDYTGSRRWRQFPYVALLWLFPLATVILTWTNDLHHLVWTGSHPASIGSYFILIYEHGPWFWIMVIFMYLLFIYGMVILWRSVYRKPSIFRWQIAMLTIGTFIPLAGGIIYLLNLSPMQGLDFVPFTFIFAGLIYAVAFFRFRFLDVVPVAREALVEKMADGIFVLNVDDCIVDMNPAAEKMAGFSKSSAQGKSLGEVWSELDRIKSIIDPKCQHELISPVLDSKIHYDIGLTHLLDKDGKDMGQLIVLRDITKRKQVQQELEALYDQERQLRSDLQEEIDNRSKYIRAIIHELKTPLTAVLCSSDVLKGEIHDKTLSALVGNIWRASSNLEQRIDELIELARGEMGLLKINPESLDISELIQDVVSEMTPIASAKGLSLVSEIQKLPLVRGDKNRLKQVVINLLSNAIKFTDKGQIVITGGNFDSQSVLIQVRDTGRGLNEDQMKYLFDPYRRKVTDEKLSGLGIGLALCKVFVDLHKGKIWTESMPGEGSTFSFTIPLAKDPNGDSIN